MTWGRTDAELDKMCLEVFDSWGRGWKAYNKRQEIALWKGGVVRAKEYEVLRRAVEDGVSTGIARYYKHRDEVLGGQEGLAEEVADRVVDAICEWFDFELSPAEELD